MRGCDSVGNCTWTGSRRYGVPESGRVVRGAVPFDMVWMLSGRMDEFEVAYRFLVVNFFLEKICVAQRPCTILSYETTQQTMELPYPRYFPEPCSKMCFMPHQA
jgi:hypothetical protein